MIITTIILIVFIATCGDHIRVPAAAQSPRQTLILFLLAHDGALEAAFCVVSVLAMRFMQLMSCQLSVKLSIKRCPWQWLRRLLV